MNFLWPLIRTNGGTFPIEGDPLFRNILLIGYLLSFAYLIVYLKKFLIYLVNEPTPFLLVFWAFISAVWSQFPELSIRRSLAFLFTTLFGIIVFLRFKPLDFLRLINISLWIAMLTSILLVFLKPDWGTEIYFNGIAWRGAFIQKNLLGFFCALLIVINFPFIVRKRQIHWFQIFKIGLLMVILFFSKSTSALVLTLFAIFLFILLRMISFLKKDAVKVVVVFSIVMIFFAFIFWRDLLELFLSFFNKEITLTGRLPLWQVLLRLGVEKFFGGYGYGTFWLGWNGIESAAVWQTVNWMPPNAHNGYIDVWLQMGLIGVLIFFWMIFRFFKTFSIEEILYDYTRQVFFVLFIVILVKNLIDTIIPRHNAIYWVLFLSIYYSSCTKRWKLSKQREG
jgi:O-antigen ligase